MTILTSKEVALLTAMANESTHMCGAFSEDEHMAEFDVEELVNLTDFNKHQVCGLLSSLDAKVLVGEDSGFWTAYADRYLKFDQVKDLVTG